MLKMIAWEIYKNDLKGKQKLHIHVENSLCCRTFSLRTTQVILIIFWYYNLQHFTLPENKFFLITVIKK